MNDVSISNENREENNPKIYNFQFVEIALVGILFIVYMVSKSNDFSGLPSFAIHAIVIATLLYQAVRIYFEYKNQLITKPGIGLKVLLFLFSSSILIAMLFKMTSHARADMLATITLLSVLFPYLAFAVFLDGVSIKTKTVLAVNAVCLTVLSLGIIAGMLDHPLTYNILISGLGFTLLSLLSFALLRTDVNSKGKYHSIHYFGRSFLFFILGLSFLL